MSNNEIKIYNYTIVTFSYCELNDFVVFGVMKVSLL